MSEGVEEKRMQKADFKAFYNKHFDRVYRFVFFRVRGNADVAQDLTSEVFMKALKHFAKYDPARSETAWIMTIARNHVINHYRDSKAHIDIEEIKFSLEGSDAREDEEVNDDKRRLLDALNELQEEERQVVEMKHLQGYRFKEIAEVLGKSAGACRIEAHRAMKKLKKILTKRYD